jgi:hypothetical protein
MRVSIEVYGDIALVQVNKGEIVRMLTDELNAYLISIGYLEEEA